MARNRRGYRKSSAARHEPPPPRAAGEIERDLERVSSELAGLRREFADALDVQTKLFEEHKAFAQRDAEILNNPANFERRLPFFERLISPGALAARRAIEAEAKQHLNRPFETSLVEPGPVLEVVKRLDQRIRQLERTANDLRREMEWRERADEQLAREAQKLAADVKRRERAAVTAALADRARGTVRETAVQVRARLRRDHPCPYCGGALGSIPHADHIHPVNKGGLSTTRNMVFVCSDCNISKRDLTLNQFIDRNELNRYVIYNRLKELSKDF